MKTANTIVAIVLALLLVLTPDLLPGETTARALDGATVAVYNGRGAWSESVAAFERFLDWKGISWEEVRARDINSNDLRPLYKALFMPGGFASEYNKALNSRGLQNIRDFVSSGGGYIGTCAGAYFASDHYISEGINYDYPLDLFKGYARGSDDEIGPGDIWVMTLLLMNRANVINTYEPSTAYMLYYGGPTFFPHPDQPVEILANYEVSGAPAGINFHYGAGRVILLGTHPEIEEDDSREDNVFKPGFNDYGSDWPFLWTAMDWLLGEAISRPPLSADSIAPVISSVAGNARPVRAGSPVRITAKVTDNDAVRRVTVTIQGDKYRMARSTPSVVLSHESLQTRSFTVGAGASGPGSRRLQPTALGDESLFEKSLSTAGYQDIEIIYRRPAAGPDEFRLEWSDGVRWNYLERPGEEGDGNPGQVFRRYRLPGVASNNPAFRIRLSVWDKTLSRWTDSSHITVMARSSEWDHSFDTTGLRPGTYAYTVSAVDYVGNQAKPVRGQFTIR